MPFFTKHVSAAAAGMMALSLMFGSSARAQESLPPYPCAGLIGQEQVECFHDLRAKSGAEKRVIRRIPMMTRFARVGTIVARALQKTQSTAAERTKNLVVAKAGDEEMKSCADVRTKFTRDRVAEHKKWHRAHRPMGRVLEWIAAHRDFHRLWRAHHQELKDAIARDECSDFSTSSGASSTSTSMSSQSMSSSMSSQSTLSSSSSSLSSSTSVSSSSLSSSTNSLSSSASSY
jgi:hypothetical protein